MGRHGGTPTAPQAPVRRAERPALCVQRHSSQRPGCQGYLILFLAPNRPKRIDHRNHLRDRNPVFNPLSHTASRRHYAARCVRTVRPQKAPPRSTAGRVAGLGQAALGACGLLRRWVGGFRMSPQFAVTAQPVGRVTSRCLTPPDNAVDASCLTSAHGTASHQGHCHSAPSEDRGHCPRPRAAGSAAAPRDTSRHIGTHDRFDQCSRLHGVHRRDPIPATRTVDQ